MTFYSTSKLMEKLLKTYSRAQTVQVVYEPSENRGKKDKYDQLSIRPFCILINTSDKTTAIGYNTMMKMLDDPIIKFTPNKFRSINFKNEFEALTITTAQKEFNGAEDGEPVLYYPSKIVSISWKNVQKLHDEYVKATNEECEDNNEEMDFI
jgi:hypothetical protein